MQCLKFGMLSVDSVAAIFPEHGRCDHIVADTFFFLSLSLSLRGLHAASGEVSSSMPSFSGFENDPAASP